MIVLINKLLVELSANIEMITKNKLNYTIKNIIKIEKINLNNKIELIKYFFSNY